MPSPKQILALDFGGQRIGVAIASTVARLPRPLTTLKTQDNFLAELKRIISAENVAAIVVGLPRSLDGHSTEQTAAAQAFGQQLAELGLPIHFQDEALTSHMAEAELSARNKQQPYSKAEIDALAATYILEDFLNMHPEVNA